MVQSVVDSKDVRSAPIVRHRFFSGISFYHPFFFLSNTKYNTNTYLLYPITQCNPYIEKEKKRSIALWMSSYFLYTYTFCFHIFPFCFLNFLTNKLFYTYKYINRMQWIYCLNIYLRSCRYIYLYIDG